LRKSFKVYIEFLPCTFRVLFKKSKPAIPCSARDCGFSFIIPTPKSHLKTTCFKVCTHRLGDTVREKIHQFHPVYRDSCVKFASTNPKAIWNHLRSKSVSQSLHEGLEESHTTLNILLSRGVEGGKLGICREATGVIEELGKVVSVRKHGLFVFNNGSCCCQHGRNH